MSTTYLQVKYRLGDLEPNIGTGSDNIIAEAISGAGAELDEFTNSATGTIIDYAVADLAASYIIDRFMSSTEGVSISIEGVSLGPKTLTQMSTNFRDSAYRKAAQVGHHLRYSKANS